MKRRFPWIKFVAGVLLFGLWHQLWEIFPTTWAAILAEGAEKTIFAHMKMLFYPYLLLSIVDYILLRRKDTLPRSFIWARLLILVSAPWIMISMWYVPQAFGIVFEGPVELTYSILFSAIGIYLAIRMEEPLESTQYSLPLKILLAAAFVAALTIFTGFSLIEPHHLFFGGHGH
jgi:hypothetical protein